MGGCWMSNPASHTAGLFMSLWSLVSLRACIYVPLLMSVTLVSIHLMNVILVTHHLKPAVQHYLHRLIIDKSLR